MISNVLHKIKIEKLVKEGKTALEINKNHYPQYSCKEIQEVIDSYFRSHLKRKRLYGHSPSCPGIVHSYGRSAPKRLGIVNVRKSVIPTRGRST